MFKTENLTSTNNETSLGSHLKSLHSSSKLWDGFFLKYGALLLASTSAASGFFINGHYRRQLGLHSFGRLGSFLSTCMVPALLSFFMHTECIMPHVAMQNMCPGCLQLRSAAMHSTLALAAPLILAQRSASALNDVYGRSTMPSYMKEPLKSFVYWRKLTMPVSNVLFAIFVGQALLGSTVTYLESRSVKKINGIQAQRTNINNPSELFA